MIFPRTKNIVCIGQAPPKSDPIRPFGRSQLYKWLDVVGISEKIIADNFAFMALVNFFPGINEVKGGHRAPSPQEIEECKPWFTKTLKNYQPKVIVPIGKLSIQEALHLPKITLQEVVGKRFFADPYQLLGKELPIIPLPHPSGASTWYSYPQNKVLLTQALQILAQELDNII